MKKNKRYKAINLLALFGLLFLQVFGLGKFGLAILPICIMWFLAGLTIGEN